MPCCGRENAASQPCGRAAAREIAAAYSLGDASTARDPSKKLRHDASGQKEEALVTSAFLHIYRCLCQTDDELSPSKKIHRCHSRITDGRNKKGKSYLTQGLDE